MNRRGAFAAGVLLGLVAGGSAVVVASIPDSNTGVITACLKASGALQVIDYEDGRQCNPGETRLSWNQEGPVGPPGPAGPEGPAGPTGPAGVGSDVVTSFGEIWVSAPEWDVVSGLQDGDQFSTGWMPALDGDVSRSLLWGFEIDTVQLPDGTGMRIDTMIYLDLRSGSAGPIPIEVCVRLADADLGPIVGSEVCLDETDPKGWTTVDESWGLTREFSETRVRGPVVPAVGSRLYLEVRASGQVVMATSSFGTGLVYSLGSVRGTRIQLVSPTSA